MHDSHCHLDLYKDPYEVAVETERAQITTIAVTNLPSAYYAARPHMSQFRYLKLAVGFHPLLVAEHTRHERQQFMQAFHEAQFVGEVGLDFSRHGKDTKEEQIGSFRFVLELLRQNPKFITLHSRQAEATVLELLGNYNVHPVVFHWYSGGFTIMDEIVARGHFFSINHAMIRSKRGQEIISRIPKTQLLTETDGPFIKLGDSPALPADIGVIHSYLAQLWEKSVDFVEELLEQNLVKCFEMTGLSLDEQF